MKDESTTKAEAIVNDYGLAWEPDWFKGQREDLIIRVAAALREAVDEQKKLGQIAYDADGKIIANLRAEVERLQRLAKRESEAKEKAWQRISELEKKLNIPMVLLDSSEHELAETDELLSQSQRVSSRYFDDIINLRAENDQLNAQLADAERMKTLYAQRLVHAGLSGEIVDICREIEMEKKP